MKSNLWVTRLELVRTHTHTRGGHLVPLSQPASLVQSVPIHQLTVLSPFRLFGSKKKIENLTKATKQEAETLLLGRAKS